jgi:hypothetical protein
MTATSISDLMAGFATRLRTIEGLRCNEDGAIVPGQINPDEAIVGVPPIENYHAAFQRGTFTLEMPIWVLVSPAVDRVGQLRLADYASPDGPMSVRAALETPDSPDGRKTLGGVVSDLMVVDFRPLGVEEVGAIGYFGGVWTVKVIGQGA